jgi:hypothetical protein
MLSGLEHRGVPLHHRLSGSVPVNPHELHIAIEGSAMLCQSDEMDFQVMHPKWVSVGAPAIEIPGSCIPRRPDLLKFQAKRTP